MGVSSDGILVFGFPVGDEDEPPEFMRGMEDFDEFVAGPYTPGDYAGYQAKVEACPADLTRYCSYDYPMFILSVRGTCINVQRGDTVEITPELMSVAPERVAAFKAWCMERGIEFQEPKWLLASMYG